MDLAVCIVNFLSKREVQEVTFSVITLVQAQILFTGMELVVLVMLLLFNPPSKTEPTVIIHANKLSICSGMELVHLNVQFLIN